MDKNYYLNEYQSLREEIIVRMKFLHWTLSLSVVLQIILLIAGYFLYIRGQNIILYLLLAPIFLNFLTFNYQSNQMTMEAAAKYIHESLKPKVEKIIKEEIWEWEKYFANHKGYYRFEAFFKILPLLSPNLIPLAIIIKRVPLDPWEVVLLIFDLALMLFVIENFRYKLRRVK